MTLTIMQLIQLLVIPLIILTLKNYAKNVQLEVRLKHIETENAKLQTSQDKIFQLLSRIDVKIEKVKTSLENH